MTIYSGIYYSLVIFLAWHLNIWEDEVYSLNTSSGTLEYAYKQSLEFELQPPVYFLLLTVWRYISVSVLWARLFSVTLILLSQLLIYRFVKDRTDRRTATFFTILFLVNPVILFAALEIRTFALVLFLTLLIFTHFYNTYYNGKITNRSRIFLILLATAGLFTQYFIGFLLFANAVLLLTEGKWKSMKIYLIDMVIPLCLLVLFIPKILDEAGVHASSFPEYSRTFKDFIVEIKGLAGQITFSYFLPYDFTDSKILQQILKGATVILFFFSLDYARIKEIFHRLSPFIISSIVILFFFVIVLWLFGKYAVENKYLLVLFVPFFISIITVFVFLKPGMQYLWFIIFCLTYLANDYNKYHELYKVKDFRSVASFIESDENNNVPLFVHRNISAENLGYYYHGINKIYPVPGPFSYSEAFGPAQWEINKTDLTSLNNKLKDYPEFYIIIDNSPLRGVNESSALLMDYLVDNFSKVVEEQFKGKITVYKFSNNEINYSH